MHLEGAPATSKVLKQSFFCFLVALFHRGNGCRSLCFPGKGGADVAQMIFEIKLVVGLIFLESNAPFLVLNQVQLIVLILEQPCVVSGLTLTPPQQAPPAR